VPERIRQRGIFLERKCSLAVVSLGIVVPILFNGSKKENGSLISIAILPAVQLPCSIGIAYCAAERSLPGPGHIGRVELQGSNSQTVRCSPRQFHPRAFCSGNRFSGRTQLKKSFEQSQWNRGNFRSFAACFRKTKHVFERELESPAHRSESERASSFTRFGQICIGS